MYLKFKGINIFIERFSDSEPGHTVTVSYMKHQCFNLRKADLPLKSIRTEPANVRLTLFEEEDCLGKYFEYDGVDNDFVLPFNPGSFTINEQ